MFSDHLAGLNPEQLRAVTLAQGSALVLAGAGSGKTRVLTTRIAWLLQTGQVNPAGVLAVTLPEARAAVRGQGASVGWLDPAVALPTVFDERWSAVLLDPILATTSSRLGEGATTSFWTSTTSNAVLARSVRAMGVLLVAGGLPLSGMVPCPPR